MVVGEVTLLPESTLFSLMTLVYRNTTGLNVAAGVMGLSRLNRSHPLRWNRPGWCKWIARPVALSPRNAVAVLAPA